MYIFIVICIYFYITNKYGTGTGTAFFRRICLTSVWHCLFEWERPEDSNVFVCIANKGWWIVSVIVDSACVGRQFIYKGAEAAASRWLFFILFKFLTSILEQKFICFDFQK